jgi:hypothetical protein
VPMHSHIPGTGMISQQYMLHISLCQCTCIPSILPKSSKSLNFTLDMYYPSPKLILSFIYPLLSFYISFMTSLCFSEWCMIVLRTCAILHTCQSASCIHSHFILGVSLSLDDLNLFYLGFPLSPSDYSL